MTLQITKEALDYLRTMQIKPCRQVSLTIFALAQEPRPPDSQQLHGGDGMRRVDSGEFRIIYEIAGDTVNIILIGKRNDDEVYRRLSRKRR